MSIPAIGTASILEIVFTASVVVALLVNASTLLDAIHTRALVKARAAQGRLPALLIEAYSIEARKAVRAEAMRVALQALLLSYGAVGIVTPEPVRPTLSAYQIFIQFTALALSVGLALWALKDRRDASDVRDILAEASRELEAQRSRKVGE